MFSAIAILGIGVVAAALSFVFIRESTEAAAMLAAYRVLIAGLVLIPLYLRERRKFGDATALAVCKRSLLPGVILGLHFIAWVVGARLTTAANATLLVSLVPVVMPFLMVRFFNESMQPREFVATALALAGAALLTISDVSIAAEYVMGDIISFISMLLFAAYLAAARYYAKLPSIWLYIVPVYLTAGIFTLIVACFFSSPFHSYTPYNLTMILGLALVSTVIGHTALNYAMQHLRGQTVSIATMAQFAIAGIVAFFLYDEVPPLMFYFASVLLLGATMLVIVNQKD